MKTKKITGFVFAFFLLLGGFFAPFVNAQTTSTGTSNNAGTQPGYTITTGQCSESEIEKVNLEIPIGTEKQIAGIKDYVIKVYTFIIGSLGILAAVKIAVAGASWILAAGNAEQITDAKSHLTGALMGLFIGLVSYMLLNIINPALVDFTNTNICPPPFAVTAPAPTSQCNPACQDGETCEKYSYTVRKGDGGSDQRQGYQCKKTSP